jgi:hypothetical protein
MSLRVRVSRSSVNRSRWRSWRPGSRYQSLRRPVRRGPGGHHCRSAGRAVARRRSPGPRPGRIARAACARRVPREPAWSRRRWRIHGEIGRHFGCAAPDDEPAECVAVVDALGSPAPFSCRGFQRVACRGHVAAVRGGEEIQVFCRPCCEMLREQGRSPGQQKSPARGQAEEQAGHLELEIRQVRHAGPSRGSLRRTYAANMAAARCGPSRWAIGNR